MEHFGYLFATYSIIFVAIFLYVVFIWQRQSRLESEVHALEAKLKALAAPKQESAATEPGAKPPS